MSRSPTVGIVARATNILPSKTDSFVGRVSQRIGGPLGRYAGVGGAWWNPLRVTLLVGTLVYLSGVVFRLPCRIAVAGVPAPDHFKYLCYSDIGLLYVGRGLLQGNTPYLDGGDYPVLEYPVLTGWFLELERLITRALGGLQGTDLTDQQRVDSTLIFVDLNTVLLGALFLIALWAMVRTPVGRPWDAMMLAASPCVAAAALINWDMLPVALTVLGMACWSARRPGLAGVMFGLGAAAKLYPAFLLGPLLLLCLRAKRLGDFVMTLSTALVSWGLVNLPALFLAPDAWRSFWAFNSERGGDHDDNGDGDKGDRVEWLHRIEERREISSQRCGSDEPYRQTNQRQLGSVAEHETHHVRRRCPHRDAHSELADALLHRVRQDTEDTHHRESQRHRRERSDENSAEPWPRRRFRCNDIDRPHPGDRPLLVYARNSGTHGRK